MLAGFALSTVRAINFAILRRIGLNALNREQTYKRSLRQKMKRTSMDYDSSSHFLFSLVDTEKTHIFVNREN